MQIWDAGTTRQVADLHLPVRADSIATFIWSPDSRYIAVSSPSAMLVFYDTATGKQVYKYAYIKYQTIKDVTAAAWSPNGKFIVVGGLYGVMNNDDLNNNVAGLMIFPAMKDTYDSTLSYDNYSWWVSTVEWSPDGKFIASASRDTTVQVWDAATGQTKLTYTGHTGIVNAVSWSPDGQLIASGSDDGTVQVWRAE